MSKSFQLFVDNIEITKEALTSRGVSNGFSYIMAGKTLEEKAMRKWSRYPIAFAQEVMGMSESNEITFSNQQKDLFSAVGDIVFAKQIVNDYAEIIHKVPIQTRELAKKYGVSVMSSKGTGKDFTASILIIWFLCTKQNAKIPCIAPSESQLRSVLWAEINKNSNRRDKNDKRLFHSVFADNVVIEKEKIYYKDLSRGLNGSDWFVVPRVSSKTTDANIAAGVLSGLHGDYMMAIYDEGQSIPNPSFEAITNSFTSKCNIAIILFNPSRTEGFAYQTHYSPTISSQWVKLQWSAEESSNHIISRDHIDRMKVTYGEESNAYRVYVKGLPPTVEDGSLIPFSWIQEATDRDVVEEKPTTVLGCDIGRGGDPTVVCVRKGMRVTEFKKINKIDSIDVAYDIQELAVKHNAEYIFIDSIGVGAGVYDQLRRIYPAHQVVPVCVSNTPQDPKKFTRLRDELWYRCRERFEHRLISIPENEYLTKQLSSVKYTDLKNNGGKIKIEGKDEMKKRLGSSPDYADAMNLTFYYSDKNKDRKPVQKRDAWDDAQYIGATRGGRTWMSF